MIAGENCKYTITSYLNFETRLGKPEPFMLPSFYVHSVYPTFVKFQLYSYFDTPNLQSTFMQKIFLFKYFSSCVYLILKRTTILVQIQV